MCASTRTHAVDPSWALAGGGVELCGDSSLGFDPAFNCGPVGS